jgi:hypothetical protein
VRLRETISEFDGTGYYSIPLKWPHFWDSFFSPNAICKGLAIQASPDIVVLGMGPRSTQSTTYGYLSLRQGQIALVFKIYSESIGPGSYHFSIPNPALPESTHPATAVSI